MVLHEQSSVRLDRLDILVCSRADITTVISCLTIVTMITSNHHDRDYCKADSGVLTTVAHDRDDSLPARDQVKNFGFQLVYFWFISGLLWGFILAF